MEMELKEISIKKIVSTAKFPLHSDDMSGLHTLAVSIRCFGMKLPLLVREADQGFNLIDGHRRLHVWKALNLGENIPCIVMTRRFKMDLSHDFFLDAAEPMSDSEKTLEVQNLYLALAVNLVRTKVDKSVLYTVVKYLHEEMHLGYKTIAHRIGYSKAGVQRMLNRMKNEHCPSATGFPPQHSLRRLRTELKRLGETIPPSMENAKDVIDSIQCVHEYLDTILQGSPVNR